MKQPFAFVFLLALLLGGAEAIGQKYSIFSGGSGWKASRTSQPAWHTLWFNDAAWGTPTTPSPNPGPATPVVGSQTMWVTPYADSCFFRYTFYLKSTCYTSGLNGTIFSQYSVDDYAWIFVNGVLVSQGLRPNPYNINLTPHLRVGKNVIAIKASNNSGPHMVSFGTEVSYLSGPEIVMDPDKNICEGDSVFFGPKDHYQSYKWSNGATTRTIKVGKAGKYWLTAKDTAGCDWIDTVRLQTYAHNEVNIGADQTICTGDVAKFDAGAGYKTYRWSTGDTTDTIAVNYAGTFWVEVTDANGCSSSDTAKVTIFDHASVSLGEDTILCKGDSMVLSVSFPFSTYKWDDGSTDTFRIVSKAGVYAVTISNYCGKVSDNINVDYINSIDVDLGPDVVFCYNQPYQLTADVIGATRYLWSTGDTNYQISVKKPGYYSVEVEDQCGNIGSDEIEIIKELPPQDMVPNSFTPNSDGLNETWRPSVKTYGHYSVQVIDRWGKLVWDTDDINASWDGTSNGKPVHAGNFNYRIELVNCEFQTIIFTGNLRVIR